MNRFGVHDPLAGLVLTGLSSRAAFVVVAGHVIVRDGEPVSFDASAVAARAHAALVT